MHISERNTQDAIAYYKPGELYICRYIGINGHKVSACAEASRSLTKHFNKQLPLTFVKIIVDEASAELSRVENAYVCFLQGEEFYYIPAWRHRQWQMIPFDGTIGSE